MQKKCKSVTDTFQGENMDFLTIREIRNHRSGFIELHPDFKVMRSKDLMVKAKNFYAIWNPEKGLWSTDDYDVQRMIDAALYSRKDELIAKGEPQVIVKTISDFSNNGWKNFRTYLANLADNAKQLDMTVTFSNTNISKKDYVSRRLPYSLENGPIDAYDEMMSTLFEPSEREKIEWAIGAIISGEAKEIQKFLVLYGEGGTGKSTILNIMQSLFEGYYTTFEAKSLVSAGNSFSTEVFRHNPLLAIQHDGDLSNIQDNTKLNSLVSHELMTMNEKYKPQYSDRSNAFIVLATNKPVRITDAKSGIIRRLIDVTPSGAKIPTKRYFTLLNQIQFELGAIANHCLEVYRKLGKEYYYSYKPLSMILKTDIFYNFVETYYEEFQKNGGVTLARAWSMYKEFCEESLIEHKLPKYKFRDELMNYFTTYYETTRIDGKQVRNYYYGILLNKFKQESPKPDFSESWLVLDKTESIFDKLAKDYTSQYANRYEIPTKEWSSVKTKLRDLDTTKLHYVAPPNSHIVLDFDIRDDQGNKSKEKNMEAASKFPPTYAEFSKSGSGLHLHYIYDGDPEELSNEYSKGIEIKTFKGHAALRRKLSLCNDIEIQHISSGLPIKEKKESMINFEAVANEKSIRNLIDRNLQKEIHPGTKPSIDFIYKILEDAYASGVSYDVTDLRPRILRFALKSTNQADYCFKLVNKMQFKSKQVSENIETNESIVFFDVEVFPNLFLVCWKYPGRENSCVHMVNPSSEDIEGFLKYRLVGFNNRRYDNHILYARYLGYSNAELYDLSNRIINEKQRDLFGEAYGLSYADVYDFSSKKQSLKKFQLELGLPHMEYPFVLDKLVEEKEIPKIIDYCDNDVISLEQVFNDRHADFVARSILSDISGLPINDTTQQHTARILFGKDPKPQNSFVYTDLSTIFPGYEYVNGKSTYLDENPGEGGYVYARPGFYENVVVLDIASMHPTSIKELNLFGPYTKRYVDLIEARLAIKRKEYDKAKKMFDGVLAKYLETTDEANALAYALKIVINIVYGLTSASFPNKFKDNRNKDNIVAKRGSLFMIYLRKELERIGVNPIHIKTDSVKLVNPSDEIVQLVKKIGMDFGYTFELEDEYEKMCLVNDAVYIAKYKSGKWTAVGAEFQHAYIFKTLFSKEEITLEDMSESKSVTTSMYLDMNENLGDEHEHNYIFVGKAGNFVPIKKGLGGGLLMREKDGKYYAVTGTKGYRWLPTEMVRTLDRIDDIDYEYYNKLIDDTVDHITKFVEFDTFVK